jgi:hypothetical protein
VGSQRDFFIVLHRDHRRKMSRRATHQDLDNFYFPRLATSNLTANHRHWLVRSKLRSESMLRNKASIIVHRSLMAETDELYSADILSKKKNKAPLGRECAVPPKN